MTDAPPELVVVCVTGRDWVLDAVTDALADALPERARPGRTRAAQAPSFQRSAAYGEIVGRARAFLDRRLDAAAVHVRHARTPADAARVFAGGGDRRLALLVIDADSAGLTPDALSDATTRAVRAAVDAFPPGAGAVLSPGAVLVYAEPAKPLVQPPAPYTLRHLPADPWVLGADVVCALADRVEAGPPAAGAPGPTTLAAGLADFLTARAGSAWALLPYTGSVVSATIADLERRARANGNPVLRGPSEHSLACAALARWMLDDAPYLIVVTSGMIDEFRGTLANLRQARARGFVLCADSSPEQWWPFQGTVHGAEDSRAVLGARGLPYVHLDRAARVADDLGAAFRAYDEGAGPVVLLATASALEARVPPPPVPAAPAPPVPLRARVVEDPVEPVARLIERDRVRLLWQVGAAGPEETALIRRAAARAGAALADSLTRPGTVCRFPGGAEDPLYLGTLGLYGVSARVADYLHADGQLRPRDEQWLFFLGSRIAGAATPYSARTLAHRLSTVQVTDHAADLAPFAGHRIHGRLADVLRRLLDRLDVDPGVHAWRRERIAEARGVPDPLETLPVRPMTANYFFHEVGDLVTDLIRTQGYRYTGVYDVGRCGAAAIRAVPRTGPGFSGWYGRALMGDALTAVPAIALTGDRNVLAFVGDGAAALVPDVLPSLLQQVCLDGHRLAGNVTIFRLLNGGHSIIRTYRETRGTAVDIGQTTVLNLLPDDEDRTIGPVRVVRRRLDGVDPDPVRAALLARSTVTVFTVPLSHNNEGDGLSTLALRSWHATTPEGAHP